MHSCTPSSAEKICNVGMRNPKWRRRRNLNEDSQNGLLRLEVTEIPGLLVGVRCICDVPWPISWKIFEREANCANSVDFHTPPYRLLYCRHRLFLLSQQLSTIMYAAITEDTPAFATPVVTAVVEETPFAEETEVVAKPADTERRSSILAKLIYPFKGDKKAKALKIHNEKKDDIPIPVAPLTETNFQVNNAVPKKLVVYVHENQRKIGPLCDSYQSTVDLCRSTFPALLHSTDVAILTKDLDICEGELAEICAESWKDVAGHIRTMVVVDQSPKAEIQDGSNFIQGSSRQQARIFIITLTGKTVPLEVDLTTTTVGDLKERMQQVDGIPVTHQEFMFSGELLEDGRSLGDYDVHDGNTIQLVQRLVRGRIAGPR